MPRIPVHTLDSAPENSRDQLKALEEKFGRVLNIHGEMAHSPVVLQSYVALQSVIADYSSYDPHTREAIALAVGNVNDCSYCQAAHTGGGKAAGLSEDEMNDIRRDAVEFDPKLAALLPLARETPGTWATCPTPPGRPRSTPAGPTSSSPSCPARHVEPVDQLLQPLRADRARHPRRSGDLRSSRVCRAHAVWRVRPGLGPRARTSQPASSLASSVRDRTWRSGARK